MIKMDTTDLTRLKMRLKKLQNDRERSQEAFNAMGFINKIENQRRASQTLRTSTTT